MTAKTQEEIQNEVLRKWKEMSNVFYSLEKKGLEVKECGFNGTRCEYIKGKNFEETLLKNLDTTLNEVNKIMGTNIINKKPEETINKIYQELKSLNMIQKAIRVEGDKRKNIKKLLPYEQLAKEFNCNCGRDHDLNEMDHPKKYDKNEILRFNNTFFYIINRNKSQSWVYFYLFLIIFAILMYALMPIWPYKVKLGVWWVSYILLILLIGLFTIRFIVYLFFYIFGYNIWIFPDINDEKLGFFASFKRVISCEKRNELWYTILIRICIALSTGYISFCIYKNPNLIEDAKKLLLDAFKDFYNYGEDKFVNSWNTTGIQTRYKTKTIEEIDNLV